MASIISHRQKTFVNCDDINYSHFSEIVYVEQHEWLLYGTYYAKMGLRGDQCGIPAPFFFTVHFYMFIIMMQLVKTLRHYGC